MQLPLTYILCFVTMGPFDTLTKMFWAGLANPLEDISADVHSINIELEELDRNGRRSMVEDGSGASCRLQYVSFPRPDNH